ncbi:MAG: CRISPR-associated endonuclease Cas6 [Ignavibacteriaceae bacterium]|nr:CRISPR-associated endonuclease Cas6 [Ignavibacteriaceae bacterium]
MNTKVTYTIIRFPGLNFKVRDSVKMRGYFGNLFRDHSELLHNHFQDGNLRYKYPLVQYKVIDNMPHLVSLNEGASILRDLFLRIKKIQIDSNIYEIESKNLRTNYINIGATDDLFTYKFVTNWMALNTANFEKYKLLEHHTLRMEFMKSILTGNILSLFKFLDHFENEKVLVKPMVRATHANFKDQKMIVFSGQFTTNVILPPLVGLGKAVSRGFGTIISTAGSDVFDN